MHATDDVDDCGTAVLHRVVLLVLFDTTCTAVCYLSSTMSVDYVYTYSNTAVVVQLYMYVDLLHAVRGAGTTVQACTGNW